MKKDILFLCQFFYPEYNSSATLPFDTAKYLAAHGLSVGALCGYPKEYSKAGEVPLKEVKDGVEIRRLRYMQLKRGSKIGRLINYFSFTASAFLHIGTLRNYQCVMVYSNPPVLPLVPIVAKKLFGTKFVFVAYDIYPEVAYASQSISKGSLIEKVMNWINQRLYKNASQVIALTDEMKQFLLKNRSLLSEDRVTTIANWAHEKEQKADHEAYRRFGYEDGQFVVSYFGNMGICQDVETMMGAALALKDEPKVKFLIIGHGSKKDHVAELIEKNGLKHVQLLDFLTGKDFEQAVAVSSCCIVSLEKGLMGTCAPSKYYSYLQGGQPVLAVVEKESYLAEEVKQEQIGYAVEIGDAQKLKNILLQMAADPGKCREMGERAKRLYEAKYSLEIGVSKYYDVFERLV